MNIQNFISYQRNVKCLSETTLEYYKNILIRYKECDFNYQKFANENFTDNRNSNITYINVIKSFLIFWKEYKKIEKISIPKREYKVQEWIKFDEYEKLLNFYSKKSKHYKANIRRILVLRVLFECGIRNNEIRGVSVNDIKDDGLLINGKGKKQRLIYINNELRTLFFEYINKWKITDKLFDFSSCILKDIVNDFGRILGRHLTPHMFRRGFATHFMNKGGKIHALSRILGHSQITTTMLYVCDIDTKSAMEKLWG